MQQPTRGSRTSAAVSRRLTAVARQITDRDALRDRTWPFIAVVIGLFYVAWGLAYTVLGDSAAGGGWFIVRQMGGVQVHAVVTVSIGAVMLAAVGTRLAQIALLVAFVWALLETLAFGLGTLETGQGPGGVIIWGVVVGPILTWWMLIAPDTTVLLRAAARVAPPRNPPERRGGVA